LIVAVLVLALSACEPTKSRPTLEFATLLPTAKKLDEFKLVHFGQGEFNLDSIRGGWSLFFFGYTRCPDVCPTELFMLAEMMRQIEQNPDAVKAVPQVVFVSVDPQQDSPEALQKYTSYYHKSFKGVTGAQEEVDRLLAVMGAFYERAYHLYGKPLIIEEGAGVPEGMEDSYLINHTASIILTNPDGDMHAVFSTPHVPEVMLRDLAAIQKAW
ncbi:MAG: SCO family protein, partial [Gammaproteobacteria bacterium]|nr:SCO family protein [Gammaproteobacteria bacterium]